MAKFVNTNPHRIYLRAAEDSRRTVRFGTGEFQASGYVADQARSTNGVYAADSQEAKDHLAGRAVGRKVTREKGHGQERTERVSEEMARTRDVMHTPLHDRYAGDPVTGAVELTGDDEPAVNAPQVGVNTSANLDKEELVTEAGPEPGQPDPSSGYEEGDGVAGLAGPTAESIEPTGADDDDGEDDGDGDKAKVEDLTKKQLRSRLDDLGAEQPHNRATQPELVTAVQEAEAADDAAAADEDEGEGDQ